MTWESLFWLCVVAVFVCGMGAVVELIYWGIGGRNDDS